MTDIKLQKLWYVQRGDAVIGPFPEKWIIRDIMLGRLNAGSLVSLDQTNWLTVADWPELAEATLRPSQPEGEEPEWNEERQRAALRWVDERRQLERRSAKGEEVGEDKRHRHDRRQPESADVLLARQRHAELEAELTRQRDRYFGVAFMLLLFLGLAMWAVLRLTPVNPVTVNIAHAQPDCRAVAVPQVNWGGCDKGGAWLRGVDLSSAVLTATRLNTANLSLSRLAYANLVRADLSYANLEGAQLQSANLQRANLSYAELSHADLRRADLRGAVLDAANFTGTLLSEAIWVDGRLCRDGSVGTCL